MEGICLIFVLSEPVVSAGHLFVCVCIMHIFKTSTFKIVIKRSEKYCRPKHQFISMYAFCCKIFVNSTSVLRFIYFEFLFVCSWTAPLKSYLGLETESQSCNLKACVISKGMMRRKQSNRVLIH